MEERARAVLARLLVEPDASLRGARRELVERVRYGQEPALRHELAEHYRALGVPDQAARWGIVEPGWARASEVRALRRTLLASIAEPHDHLGLGQHEPLPPGLEDLALPELDARGGSGSGGVWLVAALLAAVWSCTSGILGLLEIARGGRPDHWTMLSGLDAGAFFAVALWWAVRAAADPQPSAHDRALAAALRSRADRLRGWERRNAERAIVDWAVWGAVPPAVTSSARSWLVEEARRWGDRAGAARWGISQPGGTTAVERDALTAVLARRDDPVEGFVQWTRRPWAAPFSTEELAVLRAAGAVEADIDAALRADSEHTPMPALARWSAAPAILALALAVGALVLGAFDEGTTVESLAKVAFAAVPALLSISLASGMAGAGAIGLRAAGGIVAAGLALSAVAAAVVASA